MVDKKNWKAKAIFANIKSLLMDFKRERLLSLLMVFFAVVIAGGLLVFAVEQAMETGEYTNPFDALWWGIVTLTTVGYGDFAPKSLVARLLSVTMMLSGVVITSVLSGTIASIYVDRKIREGRGLEDISLKNHVLICGWNRYGQGLIESLLAQYSQERLKLAIISEMVPEVFEDIRIAFPETEIKFIRGDIASEAVLKRANLHAAKNCVIIPDESGGKPFLEADDKTILSALAVKSINSNIHLTTQIIHDQNATHLKRAQVDEIIYGDEIIRHVLSSSTITHGVPNILREMLEPTSPKRLHLQKIPSQFVEKPFHDYAIHLVKNSKGICIGVLSEEKTTSLIDILSEDSSSIDAFIKRKFTEAAIDLEEEQEATLEVNLVPEATYIIKSSDSAFLLGGFE